MPKRVPVDMAKVSVHIGVDEECLTIVRDPGTDILQGICNIYCRIFFSQFVAQYAVRDGSRVELAAVVDSTGSRVLFEVYMNGILLQEEITFAICYY